MAHTKHVPMRTCIATRVRKPKNELVRFAINPETNKVVIDETGKMRSRGANLSDTLEAFDIAVKSGALNRALKMKISKEEFAELRSAFEKLIEKRKFRAGRKHVSVRVQADPVKIS